MVELVVLLELCLHSVDQGKKKGGEGGRLLNRVCEQIFREK